MSYITKEMAQSAILNMQRFHEDVRSVFSNHGMDLLENAGRRNCILSQSQEKFLAAEIAKSYDKVISEAILLNKSLIKLPNHTEDIEIRLNSNILDVYNQTLLGKPSMLKFGDFTYFVDRTTETWNSWEDWCEKVVWWSNKKGAYLYDCCYRK